MYTAADGQRVPARIQFNGPNGTYDTPFGQGRLFGVIHGFDVNPNTGVPFFQIEGKWAFLGGSGRFLVASAGPAGFRGQWSRTDGQFGSGT